MSFTEAIQSVFSQYATFSGRARRSEYWYFALFSGIINGVLSLLSNMTNGSGLITAVSAIVSLALLVPSLAVGVRRLHDIGKPGPWLLLALVPLVGGIILIIWCCKDSDPGDNEYGPNPKGDPGMTF